MCGIGGCVLEAGEPDRSRLAAMAAALAHRGPDDQGIETVGTVGLVHTRLAIVDPRPSGHQPMRHPDGRWWLTYNGEVFNHLELRRALVQARFAGGSDTETLLHALARWDEAAVARCNGLFAFAALDVAGRRLLLVRDRFGVKPLYYARHAGGVWFASEIGALLAAGVPRRARPDVLGHAVQVGWANGPLTAVEGVRRVLPGTLLEVSLDDLAIAERRWYDPAAAVDAERMAGLAARSREDATREVATALRRSVERRLMADVPVGTMCSGGLDSSLVAAFARESGPIHAFNAAVVDQPEVDEGPWAAKVAAALDLPLHTVPMTADRWRAGLVEVVRHIEYPLTHESSVPMAAIAELARDQGVKVLLSGEGADELFGGYPWLHPLDAADFAARGRPPERWARAVYRALQRRGLWARRVIPDPAPGDSAAVTAYEADVVRRSLSAYGHDRGPRGRLAGRLLADLSLYLPHLLNRQDKSTMKHSIETREPFLDPDLVALALNLPLEVRIEPERKAVLRRVAEQVLPEDVVRRPKVGFGFDVSRYLDGHVRTDFLARGRLREVLGIDRERWDELWPQGRHALLPVTAEIWCRVVLDGDDADAVADELWTAPRALRPAPA